MKDSGEIGVRVGRLETQVDSILEALHKQGKALESIGEKISAASRTDWKMVIAAAALCCTIVGGLGMAVVAPLTRDLYHMGQSMEIGREMFMNHKDLSGHPEARIDAAVAHERIDGLREATRELDDKLQKELAGVRAEVVARLDALDTVLQREIDLKTSDVGRLREWQMDHDHEVGALNARQNARLDALERATFEGVKP